MSRVDRRCEDERQTGIRQIEGQTAQEVTDLKQTNLLTGILDVAAGIAALGSFLFGITGAIAAILAGVSILMKALQTVDTFGTFGDIVELHAMAADGVRRGEVTIDAQ